MSFTTERPPVAPGLLFHNPDEGRSGCPSCGWSGVPTPLGGVRQDICPACEATGSDEFKHELELWLRHRVYGRHGEGSLRRVAPKVGRNDPCHCGSGRKFKKCHGAAA